jgi:hypothetical protein
MDPRTTHEKRVEAGRKGGLAEHECRGRECTHPSHQRGEESESTRSKRSEAGRRGAETQSSEGKAKGGRRSRSRKD